MLIVNPRTGDTLYSKNAGKLFMPASNMKIITSAAALTLLGPDYTYKTTFLASGEVRDSLLDGDLLVIGRGDPTVSDNMRGIATTVMDALADSIRAHGIRQDQWSACAAWGMRSPIPSTATAGNGTTSANTTAPAWTS